MGKQYSAMSAEEFKRLKMLFEAGINVNQVHKFTGRGKSTLWFVKEANTFEDYKTSRKAKAKEAPSYQARTVQPVPGVLEASKGADIELVIVLNEVKKALRDLAEAYNHNSEKLDEVLETKRPWIGRLKD